MRVLVTGGTGYIGSHTALELLQAGDEVILVDDLSNSERSVVEGLEQLTGKTPVFYEGDVRDRNLLRRIFAEEKIDTVMHFAGFKAVGESVAEPLKYYENNLESVLHLLEVMAQSGCKSLIFSSSATVYGSPMRLPIKEDFPLYTTNPYGTTKLMIEKILQDLYQADPTWNITILRYFNPIGNEPTGTLGEKPRGIPNNLMPYLVRVATGQLPELRVFGDDYDTLDGTGVRDYIHVVDLARGHLLASRHLHGLSIYNLGTGHGYSVLEIIKTFERVNHVKIPYRITARREGDIAACYADASKAERELGFVTEKTLEDMCRDSYTYIKKHQE